LPYNKRLFHPYGKLTLWELAAKGVNKAMEKKPPPDFRYIVVKWADAHQGPGEWCVLDEEDKDEHIITTVGLMVSENDGGKPKHLTVAQSLSPDGFVDHVIYIPHGMVRHIATLQSVFPELPLPGSLQ